jgi:hypothetical protein
MVVVENGSLSCRATAAWSEAARREQAGLPRCVRGNRRGAPALALPCSGETPLPRPGRQAARPRSLRRTGPGTAYSRAVSDAGKPRRGAIERRPSPIWIHQRFCRFDRLGHPTLRRGATVCLI